MNFDLIAVLFLVGPMAVAPLGLILLRRQTLSRHELGLLRVAGWVQPFAALSVIGSFTMGPGRFAAALTVPWLLFGGFLGCATLLRLLHGGWRFPSMGYTAALMYLPIGAAWLFASRAGINPMNFGEPIVLLTAVHFHFSGFGASILAGEVTRRLPVNSWARRWIIGGVLLGTPLVAAGFVFSALLKTIAILFFGSTLATLAVKQWFQATRLNPGWPRAVVRVSSLSIVIGMTLAAVYGVTDYLDWAALSIPQMARWHGTVNALGFSVCGLLGWVYAKGSLETGSLE